MEFFPEYHEALPQSARPVTPRDQAKIKLHHDVLDIVVHFVYLGHRPDLYKLCRGSKQLYFVCIPWIYRDITIDFSDCLSLPILQRLSNNSSRLPAYVRTVALEACSQATTTQWILLDKALSQFTRLQKLSWDNFANLPDFVLTSIHCHHPKSILHTKVTQIYAGQATDRLIRVRDFFTSPVLGHLTSFDFSAKSNEFLYDNLKRDLLELLTNAPSLVLFRIYRGPVENDGRKCFPEMLPQLSEKRLPQLRVLSLETSSLIFTRRELEAWASQDGWAKLQYLTLSRATDLIPFISRVPRLTYLNFIADQGEGMDELTKHLQSCTSPPFGIVRTLVYSHYMSAHDPYSAVLMHIMPWSILDKTSATLTEYISWHQPYEVFYPGFATPTTSDLIRFRANYPRVTDLALDIRVRHNCWPPEVLTQLAKCHNVKKLRLYVHQSIHHSAHHLLQSMLLHHGRSKSFMKLDFRDAVKFIMDIKGTPYREKRHHIEFKLVRDYKEMEPHITVPDWTFWMNETGWFGSSDRGNKTVTELSPRRKYAKMSEEELEARKRSVCSLRETSHRIQRSSKTKMLDDDWADIIMEMTRRQKNLILEKLYGDGSVTLYDRWTSRGNALVEGVAV